MITENPDPSVRLMQLRTGKADFTTAINIADIPTVEATPELKWTSYPGKGIFCIVLNHFMEPFNDERMRRAFALAIDRDEINRVVFNGLGYPGYSHLSPLSPYYYEPPGWRYNPEKARELIEEAGYGDGVKVRALKAEGEPGVSMAKVVQSQLKRVGIEMELNIVEAGIYLTERKDCKYEVNLWN